ncbi:hypothetical protein BDL97_03G144100 [Sphagnum fallax]|nr:hypothetical protein BDL97_03G144100 [Sphagnum fallax]
MEETTDLDSRKTIAVLPPPAPPLGGAMEPAITPAGYEARSGSAGSVEQLPLKNGRADGVARRSTPAKCAPGAPPPVLKKVLSQATRGGYGRTGRPIDLLCNHFAVKLTNMADVYHYNVTITPEASKKINRDVMNKLRTTYGAAEFKGKHGAYDGRKSLFTSGPLNFSNQQEYPVFLHGSPDKQGIVQKETQTVQWDRKFIVHIDFAAKVNMRAFCDAVTEQPGGQVDRAQDALRVLDMVLRESASSKGYLLVWDNFFHPSFGQLGNLGEGVEAWRGFHASIRATQMGLTLNLDTTTTTVIKPIMVEEFIREKLNMQSNESLDRLDERGWNEVKIMLKKVKVKTTHLRVSRTHTISGFSPLACKDLKFLRQSWQYPEEPKQVSVANYYWEVYKHRLKYPNAPALDVGRKGKPIYIPLELCKIVEGQWYTKPLSQIQHQKQIDFGRQSPQDRRAVCESAIANNKYDSDELFQEFGLSFNPQLAKVSARLLEPPSLLFGGGRKENPREGRWNFNNKIFTEGCEIPNWVVVVFDRRCHDGHDIAQSLVQACNKRGMPQNNQCFPPDERVRRMFHFLTHHRPMFILAVLPDKDSEIYVPFKKMCEVTIGVASQCMVKPRQLNDQYLGNLALKINLKLGGYNSPLSLETADFLGTSTIIFGMDVSHPGSLGDVDSPSIAARCCQIHLACCQICSTNKGMLTMCCLIEGLYSARVRTQPSKMEMIEGLYEELDGQPGGMVKDLLIEFYNQCSGPENLDGISESQFQQCLDLEVTAFIKACEALDSGYHPKITFIVTQKRQHTRFFPVPNSHYMRNGNVLPGTIIDKDVHHPSNYDFFLCSHAGLFGTTRPTHYHVLYNENDKFTPDHLQQLTNHLCYASMYLKFHIGQLILLAAVHYLLALNLLLKFWNLQNYVICMAFIYCGNYGVSLNAAAPAAYAHCVALRFRKLLDTETGSDTNSVKRSFSGSSIAGGKPIHTIPVLKLKSHESMFFC